MKQRNFVAKYAREFNKSTIHRDKKKALKKGYRKHKGKPTPYSKALSM